jgi:uncharacterized membrane protein
MTNLILAAALFVGSHFLISSTRLRTILAARLGERAFAGAFSVLALGLVIWLVAAFKAAPRDLILWSVPGAAQLALAVMPLALLLAVTGFATPNPTAVLTEPPAANWQPRGIFTVTRHPVMWGFGIWALLHILADGDLAAILLFGAFAVLALGGTLAIDAKKRRRWSTESWRSFSATTSNLPFLAILQRRARLDWRGIGWIPLAVTVVLYGGIVAWFHTAVIGARLLAG